MAVRQAPSRPARAGNYPSRLECDVSLHDGGTAHVRPIRPADGARLAAFHERLSPETVYRRFFSAHPHLRPEEIEDFTVLDYRDRLALVAMLGGELIAVARYEREEGTDRAEVAFVVADHMQGSGIGTILLEHLAAAARHRGLTRFFATTLASNRAMQEVFAHAGFCCDLRYESGAVDVSFPITPTDQYLTSVLERTAASAAARAPSQPGEGRVGWLRPAGSLIEAFTPELPAGTRIIDASPALPEDEAIALLAVDPGTDLILVTPPLLPPYRRLTAALRFATRRKPVCALDPYGRLVDVWEQGGVERLRRADDVAGCVRRILQDLDLGRWTPAQRGTLVTPPGCHPMLARELLDAAHSGDDRRGPRRRLEEVGSARVLETYGIDPRLPVLGPRAQQQLSMVIGELDGFGLAACCSWLEGTARRTAVRLLPLTDVDALDLSCGPGFPASSALTDLLQRAVRLVEDQADISRVRLTFGAAPQQRQVPWSVSIHPERPTGDDPFVRRLPA